MPISQINTNSIANGAVVAADLADGAVTRAKIGYAGAVLQVVSATKTDVFTTTNTSWVDITGLSVTITPSSATSRILVMANLQIDNATTGQGIYFRFVRNSTPIAIGDSSGNRGGTTNMSQAASGGRTTTPMNGSFLDSPATTSATTYKCQTACLDVGTMVVNRSAADSDNASYPRSVSTITVMEIAG